MKQPLIKTFLYIGVLFGLSACGGGGGGSGGAAPQPATPPDQPPGELSTYNPLIGGFAPVPTLNRSLNSCKSIVAIAPTSTITGQVFFQRVALSAAVTNGLDYSNISAQPSRGVIVEAVQASGNNCSDTVIDATITDGTGSYGLIVPNGQSVCVRARAQMTNAISGAASWSFNVTDNARSNSPYYLSLNATPVVAPEALGGRVAASGWNNGSQQYDSSRAAAPFAILDTVCDALDTVLQQNNNLSLSEVNIRWGKDNKALAGDLSLGEIEGPFYSLFRVTQNGTVLLSHNIFLLGDADADTDEYDRHVIAHEFAHFFSQDQSRSDSVGGGHGINDLLDMSVAFDEGFANAFSGIALAGVISAPELYRDTDGVGQQNSFGFYLDSHLGSNRGWYSEFSVNNVVYNAYDSTMGGADQLSLGFAPIYDAWIDQRNTDAAVSLFSFIHRLKTSINIAQALNLDMLAAAEKLETVVDDFGSNEDSLNNPEIDSLADIFPIYSVLNIAGPATTVCSNPQGQRQNGISVYRRLVLNILAAQDHTFTVTPVGNGKAQLIVERRGDTVLNREQGSAGTALTASANLPIGNYLIRVADVDNASAEDGTAVTRCFDVLVN